MITNRLFSFCSRILKHDDRIINQVGNAYGLYPYYTYLNLNKLYTKNKMWLKKGTYLNLTKYLFFQLGTNTGKPYNFFTEKRGNQCRKIIFTSGIQNIILPSIFLLKKSTKLKNFWFHTHERFLILYQPAEVKLIISSENRNKTRNL